VIVAIDNNVLVSLVSDRAVFNNLETFLQQCNATLLIPTPVVAEFIAKDHNRRRMQGF
jgi:rRNA-processing protein FCF1